MLGSMACGSNAQSRTCAAATPPAIEPSDRASGSAPACGGAGAVDFRAYLGRGKVILREIWTCGHQGEPAERAGASTPD